MKRLRLILCVAGVVWLGVTPTMAQQKLGDLMAEKGLEWIVGKWEITSPGFLKTMHLEWDLDRRMIRVYMARPKDYKYLGMMIFNASKKEIKGVGADTMGRVFEMVWRLEDTAIVQRCIRTDLNGDTSKNDFVFTKADNSTMKMEVYAIDEEGRRGAQPLGTCTYKRESEKEE